MKGIISCSPNQEGRRLLSPTSRTPHPPPPEASEWERELQGEAPASVQCHTILLLPRSPEEAMGMQHLTLKPILQSAI